MNLLGPVTRVTAEGPDQVYKRTDRDGRVVYTNVGNVSVDGAPPEALDLPALTRLDLTRIPAERLPAIDQQIDDAHASTQAGEHCTAIRAASRVPLRTWIWQEHQRELFTAAGLFAFSLVVGFAWSGAVMRTLMPIAPFAGAIFLGYVATARSQEAVDDLHTGLRACSADLPEPQPQNPVVVKQRLSAAVEFQSSVQRIFTNRQEMVDAMANSVRH
jgi:hypothetical protein